MTSPRPAAFPGGRVLAGWWKQLAAWRPQSLWIGSVSLERAEALCSIRQIEPLTPLEGMLLANLDPQLPSETAQLDRRLGVSQVLLERLLAKLERKGALTRNSHGWVLTATGSQARVESTLPGKHVERRSFWFVADLDDSESHVFVLPANPGVFQPVESNQINRGSLHALRTSVQKDAQWKRSRGFPLEVEDIIAPEEATPANDVAAWEKIVIVHPYRLQAAIITYFRASGEPAVAAFPYQEHGWSLGTSPAFDIAASWQEIFPNLPLEPAEELVADAWKKWLVQRGPVGSALDHYRLERHVDRIRVVPPADMPDVLGAPRGDLSRGEAWLILAEGPLRRAIPMEMEPLKPPAPTAAPDVPKPE
ncbi:MAG TPA: hypothetical protein VGP68_03845 [Gemmataceae bacterium]|nr:hypothetical protein [Gemmataceae bacterium]